jgi:molecular chaperone GrpE
MVNKHNDDEFQDDLDFTNEDTEQTDPELEDIEENTEAKLKKLRTALKEAEEAKRAALETLARERADFLNARKRLEEQTERDRERITLRHIEEILPVVDSFDMAMSDPKWAEADEIWRKGIEGIYAQLMAIFKSYGVETLIPLGAQFNPHEHEALLDSGSNDIVASVIQKGYKRGSTVIRPAKVAVGTTT